MIKGYLNKKPLIKGKAYLADEALIIGDVLIEAEASIWYGAIVRGDLNKIIIGEGTNIQENAILHPTTENRVEIGKSVTIGHGAIVHACKVGTGSLIGMNATILDGAEIGEYSIVAAQTLVLTGSKIPPRSLVVGVPGKIARTLTDQEVSDLIAHNTNYQDLAKQSLPKITGGK